MITNNLGYHNPMNGNVSWMWTKKGHNYDVYCNGECCLKFPKKESIIFILFCHTPEATDCKLYILETQTITEKYFSE